MSKKVSYLLVLFVIAACSSEQEMQGTPLPLNTPEVTVMPATPSEIKEPVEPVFSSSIYPEDASYARGALFINQSAENIDSLDIVLDLHDSPNGLSLGRFISSKNSKVSINPYAVDIGQPNIFVYSQYLDKFGQVWIEVGSKENKYWAKLPENSEYKLFEELGSLLELPRDGMVSCEQPGFNCKELSGLSELKLAFLDAERRLLVNLSKMVVDSENKPFEELKFFTLSAGLLGADFSKASKVEFFYYYPLELADIPNYLEVINQANKGLAGSTFELTEKILAEKRPILYSKYVSARKAYVEAVGGESAWIRSRDSFKTPVVYSKLMKIAVEH